MKKLMKKLLIAAALALPLTGCVSVAGRAHGTIWGSPYAATRLASTYAGQEPALWADVPFEAVLDTVLLPIDLLVYPFVH